MLSEEQYWESIQQRVCVGCKEGNESGECRITNGRACPVKKYFPQILEVVGSVYSRSIEPYQKLLRNKICGICLHQSPDGVCSLRNEVECALDRYFPLIVEVIEEAQLKDRLGMGKR